MGESTRHTGWRNWLTNAAEIPRGNCHAIKESCDCGPVGLPIGVGARVWGDAKKKNSRRILSVGTKKLAHYPTGTGELEGTKRNHQTAFLQSVKGGSVRHCGLAGRGTEGKSFVVRNHKTSLGILQQRKRQARARSRRRSKSLSVKKFGDISLMGKRD